MSRICEAVVLAYKGCCHYCSNRFAITLDHIVPTARGGRDSVDNFVLACHFCNSAKKDNILPPERLTAALTAAEAHGRFITSLLQKISPEDWCCLWQFGETSSRIAWCVRTNGALDSVRRVGRWTSQFGRADVYEDALRIHGSRGQALHWLWGGSDMNQRLI